MSKRSEAAKRRARCPKCGSYLHKGECPTRGPRAIPAMARLGGRLRHEGDCLVWTGGTNANGYGQIVSDKKKVYVHRLVWESMFGPVPEGKEVGHHCDNPPCVLPAHLFLTTSQGNKDDMVTKGRSRHGERHWNVRLTADDVKAIRARPEAAHELAAEYGVGARHIRKIQQGLRWPERKEQ